MHWRDLVSFLYFIYKFGSDRLSLICLPVNWLNIVHSNTIDNSEVIHKICKKKVLNEMSLSRSKYISTPYPTDDNCPTDKTCIAQQKP